MKTLITACCLIILIGQKAICQITITSADMPSANDTIRFSNANVSPGLPFLVSGANQTWDFSGLIATNQDVEPYKSSLQTPYAFFFFGLNKYGRKIADTLGVAAFSFTDIYNYYKKSNAAFEVEGIGLKFSGIPIPAYYSEKDKLYQFPLLFNDRDSSIFKFSVNLPTLGSYSQVGYRINEVEGWGSVTTPFGTFNCLKVKSFVNSNDSLNFSGFPLKFNRRTIEYKWLANGQKIPILEITGNLIGTNFTPTTVKYRDIPRSLTPITIAPVAIFSASLTTVPVNELVQFTNTSSGVLPTYLWTISPPDFALYENNTSDTSKNPTVSFTQAGQYTVKLNASNFFGNDDEVKTNYITVFDPTSVKLFEEKQSVYSFGNQFFMAPDWLKETQPVLTDISGKAIPAHLSGNEILIENQANRKNQLFILRANNGKEVFIQKVVGGE